MELSKRKTALRFSLSAMILLALHTLLTPLYLSLIHDVVWAGTILPSIVGWVQLLLEYALYWLLFALLLGIEKHRLIFFPIGLLFSFLQHALSLVAGYALMGFPTRADFFSDELPSLLWELGFDLLLFAGAVMIVRFVKGRAGVWLLSLLPSAFHVVSLVVFLIWMRQSIAGSGLGIAIDFVVDILCFFLGVCAIPVLEKILKGGKVNETVRHDSV